MGTMLGTEQNGMIPLGNYESIIFERLLDYGNPIFESYEIKVGMACFIT